MLAFAEGREAERRVQPDVSDSTLSTLGGTGLEVRICGAHTQKMYKGSRFTSKGTSRSHAYDNFSNSYVDYKCRLGGYTSCRTMKRC